MIAYPTDAALLRLAPEEFFDQIVGRALDARAIVEGPNFYFGHARAGDIHTLGQLTAKAQIMLDVVEPFYEGGQPVSSSRVREAIAQGDVDSANRLLTAPYRVRGMVVHGAGRGAGIGFPTANLDAIDTLLPGAGVYAGGCEIGGKTWAAAIHIGPNPTFGEARMKVEVHVIDFQGTLCHQPLEVDFLCRLRDVARFESVGALIEQLKVDVRRAREFVANRGGDAVSASNSD